MLRLVIFCNIYLLGPTAYDLVGTWRNNGNWEYVCEYVSQYEVLCDGGTEKYTLTLNGETVNFGVVNKEPHTTGTITISDSENKVYDSIVFSSATWRKIGKQNINDASSTLHSRLISPMSLDKNIT